MNKRELECRMKRYGDTQSSLANALGISRGCLNSKINERQCASFSQPEIVAIKKRYNLSADDIENIFFNSEVS